jgi:hypothetical protein
MFVEPHYIQLESFPGHGRLCQPDTTSIGGQDLTLHQGWNRRHKGCLRRPHRPCH